MDNQQDETYRKLASDFINTPSNNVSYIIYCIFWERFKLSKTFGGKILESDMKYTINSFIAT